MERNMTRTELRLKAGISSVSLAKLKKEEGMTTNVLVKICSALKCNIGDNKYPSWGDIFFAWKLPIIKTIGTLCSCEVKYV